MDKQKEQSTCCKKTSIGGQAVLEGVMMRSSNCVATAVRDADGIIRLETKKVKSAKKRSLIFRLPIFRGAYSLFQSLFSGTAVLMRSSEIYGEGEPSKAEKWLANKLKIDVMSVVGAVSLILALFLSVALFMFLPQTIRILFQNLFNNGKDFSIWGINLIEGGLKVAIFLTYILLVSLVKDVRRTFMYHGAEHKTITCYEKGLELTVENAKKCSRVHDRCGTTFIVFVMAISIIVFALFESSVGIELKKVVDSKVLYNTIRIVCKILLLPLVAGLSYELLKGLSKTNFFLVYPLKVPGLLLQRITTKEPTDDMLEVAIASFKAAKEMEDNPNTPEKRFVFKKMLSKTLAETVETLKKHGIEERAEAEWIISLTTGIKRDQYDKDVMLSVDKVERIEELVSQRIKGRPLWYCIGDTDFFGYTIKVDERVLIPRPETEILCEQAIKCVFDGAEVLDLCTGSGAIAITINKETGAKVVAVDISSEAISLARENANENQAQVEFIQSDMFSNLEDRKFDLIISNPPYIRSSDIDNLQDEVKNFEPILALDGGKDGLDFYRIIADNASKYLNENGVVLLECGYDQAKEIAKLFNGYEVEIIKDYSGIERIVKAKKNV